MVAFRNFANRPANFWKLLIDRADPLASEWGYFKGEPPLCNVYLFISPVKYAYFKGLRMQPSDVSVFIKFYSPSFATQQQTLLWNTENIFVCQRFLFPEHSVLCLIPTERSFGTSVFCLPKISLPRALRLMSDTNQKSFGTSVFLSAKDFSS